MAYILKGTKHGRIRAVTNLANHKARRKSEEPIKKPKHVADAKRGKTSAEAPRLTWILLLIGRKSGVSFLSQSCRVTVQNRLLFNTQVKLPQNLEEKSKAFIINQLLL